MFCLYRREPHISFSIPSKMTYRLSWTAHFIKNETGKWTIGVSDINPCMLHFHVEISFSFTQTTLSRSNTLRVALYTNLPVESHANLADTLKPKKKRESSKSPPYLDESMFLYRQFDHVVSYYNSRTNSSTF